MPNEEEQINKTTATSGAKPMADALVRNSLARFVAGLAILEFVKFNLKTLLRYFMFEDRFRVFDIGTLTGANAFGLWLMSRYLKMLSPLPQVCTFVAVSIRTHP